LFCTFCGKVGHVEQYCHQANNVQTLNVICYNCGGNGHTEQNCIRGQLIHGKECYNCGQPGHISRDCHNNQFNRNNYPEGSNMPDGNQY
jgi:cellular nucleic acid-binding protein